MPSSLIKKKKGNLFYAFFKNQIMEKRQKKNYIFMEVTTSTFFKKKIYIFGI